MTFGTYLAHTALGWGWGDTIEEALRVYWKYQRRNYPHLNQEDLDESWGYVWKAPAGANSQYRGIEGMWWQFEDDRGDQIASLDQRVANIGNVPEQWRVPE
jgi:hypothetical protein